MLATANELTAREGERESERQSARHGREREREMERVTEREEAGRVNACGVMWCVREIERRERGTRW